MFEKNDRILFIMRFVINVVSLVIGILCIIWGIVLAAKNVPYGFIIIFAGPVSACLFWLVWQLLFSYFCDIKLIRNKLYGLDNDDLSAFIGNHETADPAKDFEDAKTVKEEPTVEQPMQEEPAMEQSIQEEPAEEISADFQKSILLKKLNSLRDKGRISEKEYEEKKKYILNL